MHLPDSASCRRQLPAGCHCQNRKVRLACLHTGAERLDADDGTLHQEPGSGIRGRIAGSSIAVGNLEWVTQHSCDSSSRDAVSSVERVKGSQGAGPSGRGQPSAQPGQSAVYVSVDGRVVGIIHVADMLRPDARETVQALRQRGLQVVMISGEAVCMPFAPLATPHGNCLCLMLLHPGCLDLGFQGSSHCIGAQDNCCILYWLLHSGNIIASMAGGPKLP